MISFPSLKVSLMLKGATLKTKLADKPGTTTGTEFARVALYPKSRL